MERFKKDTMENLFTSELLSYLACDRRQSINCLVVCPTHHLSYDSGDWVIIPCESSLRLLIAHEVEDFMLRERLLADQNSPIPRRTLPDAAV